MTHDGLPADGRMQSSLTCELTALSPLLSRTRKSSVAKKAAHTPRSTFEVRRRWIRARALSSSLFAHAGSSSSCLRSSASQRRVCSPTASAIRVAKGYLRSTPAWQVVPHTTESCSSSASEKKEHGYFALWSTLFVGCVLRLWSFFCYHPYVL